MGKFEIEIRGGNEAMRTTEDVAQALRQVAEKIAQGTLAGNVLDENGNTCGHFRFVKEGESFK